MILRDFKWVDLVKSSQHGFVLNTSCQTNLISFFDQATGLVDQWYAMKIVYLNFS